MRTECLQFQRRNPEGDRLWEIVDYECAGSYHEGVILPVLDFSCAAPACLNALPPDLAIFLHIDCHARVQRIRQGIPR